MIEWLFLPLISLKVWQFLVIDAAITLIGTWAYLLLITGKGK